MTMVVEQDLIDLAERCERLTAACLKTDEDIARAIGYVPWGGAHLEGYGWNYVDRSGASVGIPPKFTGSYDAAESLMPDNTGVIQYWILGKKPTVSLQRDGWDFHLSAETKILALCAAALRARASLKGEG